VQAGECPHCGAPTRALQEYCLECGGRLTGAPGVATTLASVWRPRPAWYPAEWAWPVLGLLAVAAVTLAAVISVAEDEPDASILVATRAATGPLLSAALESAPTPTEPALPPQQTVAPPPTTPAPPGTPIDWPANVRNGWTVVLANLPVADGREAAVSAADDAIGAGVREVGILDSGEFASLHPGYFVVFAGVYDTPAAAQTAAERAQAQGYGAAYIRQITQ
jgi:eukaryotic-like serine/threonine-protein kinase